jgi:DNA-binding XRE family transcriptional regulator
MKKEKVKTFRSRLREDLKDPEFKAHYQEERQALKLAMKIAKLREKKGLSQQQMAKLMGTSQQAVSRIESGEYEGFTLKTLEKIAEATGTKVKIEFVAALFLIQPFLSRMIQSPGGSFCMDVFFR